MIVFYVIVGPCLSVEKEYMKLEGDFEWFIILF